MTQEEFITALKIQTSDASVKGILAQLLKPAGRSPSSKLVQLSHWYNSQDQSAKLMIQACMLDAAQLAVYCFLGLLDGTSPIENGAIKGTLDLIHQNNGDSILLNDPKSPPLQDLYNYCCQQTEF